LFRPRADHGPDTARDPIEQGTKSPLPTIFDDLSYEARPTEGVPPGAAPIALLAIACPAGRWLLAGAGRSSRH
jgi:hypothetical protein